MSIDATIDATRACIMAWAAAFNTREPERIAGMYAEDALLHGTSQPRLHVGREQIRSYFRGTSTVALGEMHIVRLSEDSALGAGKYAFTRMQDGRPTTVPARFTFVVRRQDGIWRILHHHSSAEPT